jgi:hypothetical protein
LLLLVKGGVGELPLLFPLFSKLKGPVLLVLVLEERAGAGLGGRPALDTEL